MNGAGKKVVVVGMNGQIRKPLEKENLLHTLTTFIEK